jgi:dienelactone hydrolase
VPLTRLLWLAAALGAEGLLVAVLWRRGDGSRARRVGAGIVAGNLLASLAFAAGGRLEASRGLVTRLSALPALARPSPFDPAFRPQGDPGLVRRAVPTPLAAYRSADPALLRVLLRDSLFRLPAPPATLAMRAVSAPVDVGGVRRTLVALDAADGTAIPAYLFEPPEGEAPPGLRGRPAVLVIAGHGAGIVETAGIVRSGANGAALELARAGYVTLAPELRGFGYLGDRLGVGHRAMVANALAAGSSFKAVVLADLERAVSALRSLRGVDSSRVAVAGYSLGGDLAGTLAALDPRIAAVVLGSYAGGVRDGPAGRGGTDAEFVEHFCTFVPRQHEFMRSEDLYTLVAPRPLLVAMGRLEQGDVTERDFPALARARAAYRGASADDRFAFTLEPGGHEFFVAPAIRFLARYLQAPAGD